MSGFISSIYNFIFSRKSLIILLILYVITFIFSVYHRYIYIDDAWFGEQAYWFSKLGYVKTSTIIDFGGWDSRLMVYHKLNIIIGAVLIKLFGWNYYNFKVFTFFIYCLFFLIYFKYFRLQSDKYEPRHFYLASMLMIINPLMIYLSFTYRPEILVMFCGFLSFFFIDKYLKEDKLINLIPAGIFSGLAFFTHLNAIIFPVAGFLLLLSFKKIKGVAFYSIFALLACSLYTYDLWQGNHLQLFFHQLRFWPDDVRGNYINVEHVSFFSRFFHHLLDEHERFFWSEKVTIYSSLFFLMLVVNFRKLWSLHRSLIIYMLLLMILLNVIGSHIAERYMIYYFPFTSIVIAYGIFNVIQEKKLILKFVVILLIAGQTAVSAVHFVKIFQKKDDYVKRQHELLSHIKDQKSRILVPYEFVYNDLKTRNLVATKTTEYWLVFVPKKHWQELFIKRCIGLRIRYIVLDESMTSDVDFPWFLNRKIKPNPYYRELYRDNHYIILEEN